MFVKFIINENRVSYDDASISSLFPDYGRFIAGWIGTFSIVVTAYAEIQNALQKAVDVPFHASAVHHERLCCQLFLSSICMTL